MSVLIQGATVVFLCVYLLQILTLKNHLEDVDKQLFGFVKALVALSVAICVIYQFIIALGAAGQ